MRQLSAWPFDHDINQGLMLMAGMNAGAWCLPTTSTRPGRGQSTGTSLSLQVQGGSLVNARQLRMPWSEHLAAMCAAADCADVLTAVAKGSEAEEFRQFQVWATQLTPPPTTVARPCSSPPSVVVLTADLSDYLARPLSMLNESQHCMQLWGFITCSLAI